MPFHVRPFVVADYLEAAPVLYPWLDTPGHPPAARVAAGYLAGPSFSGFLDGSLIGSAGVLIPWPGLGIAWAVITDLGRQHPMALHRAVVRHLRQLIDTHGLERIEATVMAGSPMQARWVEAMGFEREAPMPAWGPGAAPAIRYVLFPVRYEQVEGIERARRAGRDFVRVNETWRPVLAGGTGVEEIAGLGFLAAESAATVAGASASTAAAASAGVTAATVAGTTVAGTSALTYASAAGMLAGSAVSAYGQYAQGKSIAGAEKFNATQAERQAAQTRAASGVAADTKELQFRHLQATQRARIGGTGVTSEGSPLLAMMNSAEQAALDVARIRYSGDVAAAGLDTEAMLRRYQGRQAQVGGSLAAGASLLTGVGSAAYGLRAPRGAATRGPAASTWGDYL